MPRPRTNKDRRALTGARGGGLTGKGGDSRFAIRLLDALTLPATAEGDEIAASLTHSFHAYPARMHPATAQAVIEGLTPRSVLDPFCGSGTVLVEAQKSGARSIGFDLNPLAIRLAATKTWRPGRPAIKQMIETGRAIADASIEEVKVSRRARGARAAEKRTRPRARAGLRGQFPPHVLAELETLLAMIRSQATPEIAAHLEIALSSILYKVSLRSSDTDTSQVRKQIPRAAASRHFRERVAALGDNLRAVERAGGPSPELAIADARTLEVESASVELVLTSPPYPGTYNYVEHHQLRMDFLGIDVGDFAQKELGPRRHFRGAAAGVERSLAHWRRDTVEILTRLRRGLASGGLAVFLVGDSLGGVRAIRADEELFKLAPGVGLKPIAWASQTRRALGAREREAFYGLPKREHLILLGV